MGHISLLNTNEPSITLSSLFYMILTHKFQLVHVHHVCTLYFTATYLNQILFLVLSHVQYHMYMYMYTVHVCWEEHSGWVRLGNDSPCLMHLYHSQPLVAASFKPTFILSSASTCTCTLHSLVQLVLRCVLL